jgi:hypothetical protein
MFHEEPASPPRPAPVAGPGPTIARATRPAGPTLARVEGSSPGGGGSGGDAYDDFVDRLRRDLLREREQVGDLLGDKSW